MSTKLYQQIYDLANPKEKAEQSGKLGNFAGTVKVPGRDNYVYVRLSDNTVAECWNTRVPPITNLNVFVSTNPRKRTELMVTDIILDMHPQGIGGIALPAHTYTHTWPAYDTVYINYRQILPLRVTSAGGLTIQVNSGWYLDSTGTVKWFDGATVDLISFRPTRDCLVVTVSLNATGTLSYTVGATVPYASFSWKTQTPAPLATDYPLAAVRLMAGKSTINDTDSSSTDIQDLRFIISRAAPTNPNLTDINYIQFNVDYTGTVIPDGHVQWNSEDETLDVGLNDGVVGQLFLEEFFDYKNQTGSTITDGTPLMFLDSLGASGRITVQKAIADDSVSPTYIIGIATHDCPNGEGGKATWRGKVRGINTTGSPYGETWSDGDLIYVSPTTAGNLTNIEPEAPNRRILIAVVIHAATNGTLLLRPTWTPKLVELDDVDGQAPVNGSLLYNNGSVWTSSIKFKYNYVDDRVEAGSENITTYPDQVVSVLQNEDGKQTNLAMQVASTGSADARPNLMFLLSNGTRDSLLPITNKQILSTIRTYGWDGGDWRGSTRIRSEATENWASGTNAGANIVLSATTSGTTNLRDVAEIGGSGVKVFGNLIGNESGTTDQDFRWESDTEEEMFVIDANGDTDGNVRVGGSVNYTKIKKGGRYSHHGTARKTWNKYVADSITITAGTSANSVTDLQTMADGNFFTITEAASTPGINLIVDFVDVLAFEKCRVAGGYGGSTSHGVAIQLYNWSTAVWDTFNAMQFGAWDVTTTGGYIFGNYEFTVYDDTNYIGTGGDTGKVRVRFYHTMTGNPSHLLHLDEVSLRQ